MKDPKKAATMIVGCISLLVYGALIFGGLVGVVYLLTHW